MNSEELEEYLKSDKKDWYHKNSKGEKVWDKVKVTEFWKVFREEIMSDKLLTEKQKKRGTQLDYSFNGFVFPEFERKSSYFGKNSRLKSDENFWTEGQFREFKNNIDFTNSRFLGRSDFSDIVFSGTTNFSNTVFNELTNFSYSVFHSEAIFNISTFALEALFYSTKFNAGVAFNGATFSQFVFFNTTRFDSKSSFVKTVFSDESQFDSAILQDVDFNQTCFLKKSTFVKTLIGTSIFSNIKLDSEELLFEELKMVKDSQLIFHDCRLKTNVIFRRTNMASMVFHMSTIHETSFSNCTWNGTSRLVLKDEDYLSTMNYNVQTRLSAIEYSYRQLKKNFENKKDWELCGKAYRSEMKTRRKRLWVDAKKGGLLFNHLFYEWLLYWIYGRISGFTQSILTPLTILLFCTVIFFPFFYILSDVFYYSSEWGCTITESYVQVSNINETMKKSLAASLPILKKTFVYRNWWLSAFQTIVSAILLTFFILALRKRFKQ